MKYIKFQRLENEVIKQFLNLSFYKVFVAFSTENYKAKAHKIKREMLSYIVVQLSCGIAGT